MVKRNGETVEYQVTLNIPHLREKINKTCANRPVSCVNGEKPSDFGSDKETVYHCAEALGRRACPLRHRLRDATSPKGRGFCIPQSLPSLPKALPLGELSPKVTERARMLARGLLLFRAGHGILKKKNPLTRREKENGIMKTKFGIVGCGFLGNIVADAWKKGLLEDYELVGVTSRTFASAEKTAASVGCAACADVDALLALAPEYIVEAASVEAVRAMAVPVLRRGVNLVVLSIGAFADLAFYEEVKQAAREGGAKVHLASGAIGGFDVLQTVTLMAEALKLDEKAGIETHTGAKGFRNTPVWADHLLTDTEKTTVFTGSAKEAIATFPRRVNVAVATSLATTGPDITGVTMHSVPGWVGDDHCITAEIEGVKAVVDICSSTSAIAGWSAVALLRNLASPVCFY